MEELVITEGTETALAVRLTAGLPVWAALRATGMSALIIPETVCLVIIAADHDASGVGERAARKLTQRLLADGHHVKIRRPTQPGTDWADGIEV